MTHWCHQSPNPNSLYVDKRGSQLVHSFNSLITTTTSSNKPTQPTNKNKFCSESLSNNQSDLASPGASGVNLFEQETSRRTIWTVTVFVSDLQPELDQISHHLSDHCTDLSFPPSNDARIGAWFRNESPPPPQTSSCALTSAGDFLKLQWKLLIALRFGLRWKTFVLFCILNGSLQLWLIFWYQTTEKRGKKHPSLLL